jgi:hypothetical protein
MSKAGILRSHSSLLLGIVALHFAATDAQTQPTSVAAAANANANEVASPAVLRTRLDSLMEKSRGVRVALSAWRSEDSLAKANYNIHDPARVLLKVGSQRIVADTALRALAEKAGRIAWDELRSTFGSATQLLEQELWFIEEVRDTTTNGRVARTSILVGWDAVGDVPRSTVTDVPNPFQRARTVSEIWRARGDAAISSARKGPARTWAPFTVGPAAANQMLFQGAFRHLAAGGDPAGRRCLEGGIDECISHLGIIGSNRHSSNTNVRTSVLQVALALGGDEAYTRFASDSTRGIAERLSDASLLPVDSLISVWRSRVIEARPSPASTPTRTAAMALLWCTLLCAVSLRSSRWR